MYINIDSQLLFKALTYLNWSNSNTIYWKRYNPTVADLDRLFQKYDCTEYCENFYDSEPDYNDEEFNMYMDYSNLIKRGRITGTYIYNACLQADRDNPVYSKENHSLREMRLAYYKILRQQGDYNKYRIRYNNWQEPYFEGGWVSKEQALSIAKKRLYEIRSSSVHKRDRFWILEYTKDSKYEDFDTDICIYYYGRDYLQADFVWLFRCKK